MQELAEELHKRQHTITVVTSYPQYNLTSEEKNKSFQEYKNENGINVLRVKTLPYHKVNFMRRGISEVTIPYLFFSRIKKYIKEKVDVIIVYTPPLSLAKVGNMVKKRFGGRFILNVQDIFPQNAVDLGVIKNSFVLKYFEMIEDNAYRDADVITAHSEGNKKFLTERKRVPCDKVTIVHNWIDTEPYRKARNTGGFREKYGIRNKFILLFAGVIGPSQGLDLIISVAKDLKDNPDICFLLVGDGKERNRLETLAHDGGLHNIVFQEFVSKDDYPALVKEADVGLVCLSPSNKTPVVPGKILGYMAGSVPVVAFLHKESDGHALIKEAQCGYSVISDDRENAVKAIRRIYAERDRLREYGNNGFQYALTHFDRSICIDTVEKLFT